MAQTAAYRSTPTNATTVAPKPSDSTAATDADDFLDEIDSVLENASEVLASFRQKGGQ